MFEKINYEIEQCEFRIKTYQGYIDKYKSKIQSDESEIIRLQPFINMYEKWITAENEAIKKYKQLKI